MLGKGVLWWVKQLHDGACGCQDFHLQHISNVDYKGTFYEVNYSICSVEFLKRYASQVELFTNKSSMDCVVPCPSSLIQHYKTLLTRKFASQ